MDRINSIYWHSTINNSVRSYLVLFLLWPFLSFVLALSNFTQKEAKKVVYFFLVYYGFTFVNENPAVDAYRYALSLKQNFELPFSEFFNIVGGLYSTDTSVDIIEPLISFIVSRFTSGHNLYFAVWAAIYGFFYLKSFDLLFEKYRMNHGWNALILMSFFLLVMPITSISGVRMWTAAWIFFYGAYNVVVLKNTKFFLLALVSSLVHWSFISANAILLVYYVVGNREIVYLPIAIISFIVPRFIEPYLQIISDRIGGGIQNRISGYTSEGYITVVQESIEQSAWFIRLSGDLIFYYLIIALILARIRFGPSIHGKEEKSLFCFTLLFLAFVNFGLSIPSFGERFRIIFVLLATMYLFVMYVKLPGKKVSLLILSGLFPMLLSVVLTFRIGSESINAWIFMPILGSPIFLPLLSLSEVLFH